jgi:two-component system response regulator RegX3
MSPARGSVIIVEDSAEVSELLSAILQDEGFKPLPFSSAGAALHAFPGSQAVAAFLDWVLPDSPGIEVCRHLRSLDPLIPIIFISGRDDETTITRGLDAGADDFVVKPFRRGELIARLEAHLRKLAACRDAQPDAVAQLRKIYRFGQVEVDLDAREVRSGGADILLGPLEFRLLEYMCRNAGIAISREQILSEVYGYDADISTERVDLLVRRLRSKLGEGAARGGQLVAVPGYGYRLERRQAATASELA